MQTSISFQEEDITQSPWGRLLRDHIPAPSLFQVCLYFKKFPSDLIITRKRWSKYGDFRTPFGKHNARITINGDLNPYAFLITLIHEIAHHTCYLKFGLKVKPHGTEWKQEFQSLMDVFIKMKIFPQDVLTALYDYMRNPAASSCTDKSLVKALRKYDKKSRMKLLEELPEGAMFMLGRNKRFRKGPMKRKYYHCIHLGNQHLYLVDPLAEVIPLEEE